jgi:hypothetical protein
MTLGETRYQVTALDPFSSQKLVTTSDDSVAPSSATSADRWHESIAPIGRALALVPDTLPKFMRVFQLRTDSATSTETRLQKSTGGGCNTNFTKRCRTSQTSLFRQLAANLEIFSPLNLMFARECASIQSLLPVAALFWVLYTFAARRRALLLVLSGTAPVSSRLGKCKNLRMFSKDTKPLLHLKSLTSSIPATLGTL